MIWDKIGEIKPIAYTKYSQVFEVDIYLEDLSQKANSMREYIAIKYTQCVIWNQLLTSSNIEDDLDAYSQAAREGSHDGFYSLYVNTPQQLFIKRLDELNNAIFSRFWDDSDCDERMFYYFGLLNFKTHRYDKALRLLNKAIKQENLLNLTSEIAKIRLHKRYLKACCLEYLGLSDNKFENSELIRDAIVFLVGYDPIGSNTSVTGVIKSNMELTECNDLESVIKKLAESDKRCVFTQLEDYRNSGVIDDNMYRDYLKEIAHIVSHCLSEMRVRILKEGKYVQHRHKVARLVRFADKLMSVLGEGYATCCATLKIENDEYFSSLDILNAERENLIERRQEIESDFCSKENTSGGKNKAEMLKEIDREIAQIDFYIWYFSVFTPVKKADTDKSKERFLQYCLKTGDPVANTYYNVINMKGALINAFRRLRKNGFVTEELKDAINKAYDSFSQTLPHYSVHPTFADEWRFLEESYSILRLCFEIINDYNDDNYIELSLYNLYTRLANLYNQPCPYVINERIEKERNNPQKTIQYYTFTLSNGGKLIFRGDYETFLSATKENGIYLSTYFLKNRNIDNAINGQPCEKHFDNPPKNVSNVVIDVSEESFDDDLKFIELIVSLDAEVESNVDRHNIYINISGLSKDTQEEFCEQIEKIKEKYYIQNPFCVISNLKSAVLLGCMFSMLEIHLARLSQPLSSYVIFPVEKDDTFYIHSCEHLDFLDEAYFGRIETKHISDWGIRFGACFPSQEKISRKGKALAIKDLREYAEKIGYVFYFESQDEGGVMCHAFDLQSKPLDDMEHIISDTILVDTQVGKKASGSAENEILLALSNLYRQSRQDHRCYPGASFHEDCDLNCNCFNSFMLTSQTQKTADLYRNLREYLYSYMGVLLDQSIFLLLRDGCNNNEKRWVLFTLPQEANSDIGLQMRLCEKLSAINTYIRDVNNVVKNDNNFSILPDSTTRVNELKNQISPWSTKQKYYFVSYKCKGFTAALCIPVYKDVIYLQKKFEDKLEVLIDIRNFTDQFDRQIEERIADENCVGAFVYLSYDYMCPTTIDGFNKKTLRPADEDKCLKELELLLKRREQNKDFSIFTIFLPSDSQQENGFGETLVDLVNGAFVLFRDTRYGKIDGLGCTRRLDAYKKLFDLPSDAENQPLDAINTVYCVRKDDYSHFDIDNIKNALSKYGIN